MHVMQTARTSVGRRKDAPTLHQRVELVTGHTYVTPIETHDKGLPRWFEPFALEAYRCSSPPNGRHQPAGVTYGTISNSRSTVDLPAARNKTSV